MTARIARKDVDWAGNTIKRGQVVVLFGRCQPGPVRFSRSRSVQQHSWWDYSMAVRSLAPAALTDSDVDQSVIHSSGWKNN